MRVAVLTHVDAPQALQDVTNAIRFMTDLTRCFPWGRRVLVIRGNEDQIAMVDWLLKQFNGPAGQGTKEYKMSGADGKMAQLAYVNAGTPESLKETASQIRAQASALVFPYPALHVLAMRGTADQLARAQIQRVFGFTPQTAVALRGTADQLARAQQVIQSREGK